MKLSRLTELSTRTASWMANHEILENNTLTPLNKILVITTSKRSCSSGGHEKTNILHKILTVPSPPLIRLSHPEQIKKFTQKLGINR